MKLLRLHAVAAAAFILGSGLAYGQAGSSSGRFEELLPQTPSALNAPSVLKSGEYAANSKIGQILVEADKSGAAADGVSRMVLTVKVLDRKGAVLKDPVLLTIEHNGKARLVLHGATTEETGPGRADLDRVIPGTQMRVEGGEASFTIVAPSAPEDVSVRVSGGQAEATGVIPFHADLREMIASGYLEGIIGVGRKKYETELSPARVDDGFEQALKHFSRSNSKGDSIAVGGSAYLKGKISGKALLTIAYDSDKDTHRRLQSEVNPDEYYAVYGDASVRGFDAPSSSRLYVRIDQGRNYALVGDFNTGSVAQTIAPAGAVSQQKTMVLGSYARRLTGLRAHLEGSQHVANVFLSKDSTRQAVDELRTNGTSGPFGVSSPNAVSDSETVSVVSRMRGDLSRVVSVTQLRRGHDYVFEPFSGRILLTQAIPSEDASGNPLTLRIQYEVDQGGEEFWVAGADGQVKLNDSIIAGGSVVEDKNPSFPFRLLSANVGMRLGKSTHLVAEAAMTDAIPAAQVGQAALIDPVEAKAARVAIFHKSQGLQVSASAARTGQHFGNISSGVIPGTQSLGVEAAYAVSPSLSIKLQAQDVQSTTDDARRSLGDLGVSYALTSSIQLAAGVRMTSEEGRIPGLYAGIGNQLAAGSQFASSSGWALNILSSPLLTTTAPTDVDSTRVYLGVSAELTPKVKAAAEVEIPAGGADADGANATALLSYQAAERTRLYARAERRESGVSQYSTDGSQSGNYLSFGVDSSYSTNGAIYSEYRLRDSLNDANQQMGAGVRQAWDITEGLRLVGSAERLKIFDGGGQSGIAGTLGAEWIASERVKLTGRIEARRLTNAMDQVQDSYLVTAAAAGKLNRDWTLLLRNYYLTTKNHGTRADGWQDRFQVGAAYRPVDNNRFDLFAKYEWKAEDQILADNESRTAHVAAIQANMRISRPWYATARIAGKFVDENYPTAQGGGASSYKAALLSGRVVYDITENWDVGVHGGLLRGSGGDSQSVLGAEVGYLLASNLWLSGGVNFAGFRDRDLTADYTSKGVYLRLRWKFDGDLFMGPNPSVNRALPR